MASVLAFKRTSRYLIALMFLTDSPKKLIIFLEPLDSMPNCSDEIIAISPKLATLASGQIVLMTDKQTDRRKGNQITWQISSRHVILILLLK